MYDAYGQEAARLPSGASFAPTDGYGFNARWGYVCDREVGTYYCQSRNYAPNLARWLERDPIGFAGGMNLYAYCWGQPRGMGRTRRVKGPGPFVGGIAGGILGMGGGPAGVAGGAAFGTFLGSMYDGESARQAALDGAGAYFDTGAALTLGDPDILLDSIGCSLASEGGAVAAEEEAGSQCFAAGTQVVMADGSTKAVEDVRAGDRVESRSDKDDEKGRVVAATVERGVRAARAGHAPPRVRGRSERGGHGGPTRSTRWGGASRPPGT